MEDYLVRIDINGIIVDDIYNDEKLIIKNKSAYNRINKLFYAIILALITG